MSSRYRKHRLMALFCAFGFILCLWLGHFSSTSLQVQIGELAVAQNSNPSQLVQEGIDSYRLGDFQKAIQLWNEALKFYSNNPVNKAIVRENLARAYPQVGQTKEAIENWGQVISLYQRLGSGAPQKQKIDIAEKIAKAKIELAQVYSSIGQPKKALMLLCSIGKNGNCTKEDIEQDDIFQFALGIQDTNQKIAFLGTLGDAYRLTGDNDYKEAINFLEEGLKTVRKQKNEQKNVYITSLTNSLGNAYSQQALLNYRRSLSQFASSNDTGKFRKSAICSTDKAWSLLQESKNNAKLQEDKQGQIQAILSLSNLYKKFNEIQKEKGAIDFDCKENSFQTSIKLKDFKEKDVQNLFNDATQLINELPNSRTKIYNTVSLINLQKDKTRCIPESFYNQAETLLSNAVDIAKTLKDNRAKSFALGETGNIYECRQDYANAIDFTEQARIAAEKGKSLDSLYLWEWQTGRILKDQKKTEQAIKAYEQAISTLEGSSRSDILTANRDIKFDFQDTIEPIYRDFVAMKLSLINSTEASGKSVNSKNSESNFSSILKTIDSLKLAELQNYFGDDCNFAAFNQSQNSLRSIPADKFLNQLVKTNRFTKNTAFINTIFVDDKVAVILTVINKNNNNTFSKSHWSNITSADFIEKVNNFRDRLGRFQDSYEDYQKDGLSFSQDIYNEIVAPFTQYLNPEIIKTLVFIQDGIFRSVPMTALHDGEKFLIQKYAIATIPSLTLTQAEVTKNRKLRLLALGLSEKASIDNRPFDKLEYVDDEIEGIKKQIPEARELVNENFTRKRIETELSQRFYSIIHIATHGKFGIRPEDTFLITGKNEEKKNEKLTFKDLDNLIRKFSRNTQPLELIALTACETAVGDNRSALGLGGVAIQAGAKSALASLWTINDGATAPIAINFYRNLLSQDKMSKAQALQLVQKNIIETEDAELRIFKHPAYWSSIVLIGNWL